MSWNYRMINLFRHHEKGWLDVAGSYGGEHYYIQSSVYRLLSLLTLAQQFENEEIYIDARYVEDTELEFVKFVKAFHWVMSDTLLFEGLGYDATHERDHFNSDNLRAICEATLDNGRVPSFKAFQTSLEGAASPYLDKVFAFFDGLRRGESRLRWDRLICLYILTSAFVATYGYDWQTKSSEEFAMSAKQQIEHPEVLDNLAAWLPRLGLAQQKCLLQVFREPDTPSPEERPGPKRT